MENSEFKILSKKLNEACDRSKDAVYAFKEYVSKMPGANIDKTLALLQYVIIMCRVVGFREDETIALAAMCVSRGFEAKDPTVPKPKQEMN